MLPHMLLKLAVLEGDYPREMRLKLSERSARFFDHAPKLLKFRAVHRHGAL